MSFARRAVRTFASPFRGLGAALATAVLLLAGRSPASAQQLDSKFWTAEGTVSATALVGRTLYIGGAFAYVGPVTGGGVPLDAGSGTVLPGFPSVHGQVMAVA